MVLMGEPGESHRRGVDLVVVVVELVIGTEMLGLVQELLDIPVVLRIPNELDVAGLDCGKNEDAYLPLNAGFNRLKETPHGTTGAQTVCSSPSHVHFRYNRKNDGPSMSVTYYLMDDPDTIFISTMAARGRYVDLPYAVFLVRRELLPFGEFLANRVNGFVSISE